MRATALLWSVIIIMASLGCQSIQRPEAEQQPKRVIVFGVDDTGSYKLWNQAKNMALQVIQQLQPGDIFYCRRINEASYLDDSIIFRLELPCVDNANIDNPFDRRSKRLLRSRMGQINRIKREAYEKMAAILPTNAGRTDINGFFAAAMDRFSVASKEYQRVLIIASDLQENVNYNVELDLKGVQVLVLGFQTTEDPAETQRLKNKWIETFTRAGVGKVLFLSPEESFRAHYLQGA